MFLGSNTECPPCPEEEVPLSQVDERSDLGVPPLPGVPLRLRFGVVRLLLEGPLEDRREVPSIMELPPTAPLTTGPSL